MSLFDRDEFSNHYILQSVVKQTTYNLTLLVVTKLLMMILLCCFEQVPAIDELEMSMHALLKNRACLVVQRRQTDVNDQAEDFLNAQAGNFLI